MKSTFKILFYLKKNQLKKNGKAVIMVRITVDGKQIQFSSKVEISPDTWDVSLGRIKGKSAKDNQMNRLLDDIRASITMHYNRLISANGYVLPEQIKNVFLGIEEKADTIINLFTKYNEISKQRIGISLGAYAHYRYEYVKMRLIDFMKTRFKITDILIKEVTPTFVEEFYLYLRNNGGDPMTHNTAGQYMRKLKTALKYARDSGIQFRDPFVNLNINMERTERGFLDQSEIDLMYNTDFESDRLSKVRDVFIFSCYTGLSYIDIYNLTSDEIKIGIDGKMWIMTKRQKTGVSSNIPLLEVPKSIILKYKNKLPNGKPIPMITNQGLNRYIKEIACICNIKQRVSFHTARHTFATTVCLLNGIPIESVSKMLGHTNIKTTQIYAKVTDLKVSNDMLMLDSKINAKQKTAV